MWHRDWDPCVRSDTGACRRSGEGSRPPRGKSGRLINLCDSRAEVTKVGMSVLRLRAATFNGTEAPHMKPAAEEPPKAHIAVAAVDHLRLACLMARILPRLSTSQHVAADA